MVRGSRPKPLAIRGVQFPSQFAAARALGVTPRAIRLAVKSGRLDFVGLTAQRKRAQEKVVISRSQRDVLAVLVGSDRALDRYEIADQLPFFGPKRPSRNRATAHLRALLAAGLVQRAGSKPGECSARIALFAATRLGRSFSEGHP